MSDDQKGALTPLSTGVHESRLSLVSRGLRDISQDLRVKRLEAIVAIARHVIAVLDLDELLTVMCGQVREWFRVDHVAVLLAEEDALRIRAQEGGLTANKEVGDRILTPGALLQRSLSSKLSVIENDLTRVEGYIPLSAKAQSEACIPLIFFGETLGVMILECARQDAFSVEDVKTMEPLADIFAAAIQNSSYFGRMKQLAYMDQLTNLYNRRFFELRIGEELERAHRFNGKISLIIANIDHFHRLNGEFGPDLGDEVLQAVGIILKRDLRKMDIGCRYGQDDFAVIIPETSAENAVRVAEKLRRAVESQHFPGVPRRVTISCGVADYPTHGSNRDALVAAADKAMHLAKSAGRNHVAAAQEGG